MKIKNRIITGICLTVLGALSVCHGASLLPRSTPEAQGVSSIALLDLVTTLNQQIEGMHSIMVVRHGKVIAEGWWTPYAADQNHVLYSLSKSFTSTAVGLAASEGKVSVDDEVMKFFPDQMPTNASSNLKAMRVRDILTMSTGHQDEPPTAPDAMSAKSFLAQPVPHLPGTHFKYNTAATFMQSAIVQKVTGKTVLDYLRPRLFEPLGIENPVWDTNFEGISLGGYGLRVRTEDIAKFGQLYLQKGKWNGKQLLPESWISMATSKQVSNGSNPKSDWNQGYGFQFWRCRNNAYRGDGAFGQYCVVMPDQDAVIAITSGIGNMQAVLDILWEKFLPSCQPKNLAANTTAQTKLIAALSHLQITPAQGKEIFEMAAAKVLNTKYVFTSNAQNIESVSLKTDDSKNLVLTLRSNGKDISIPAGSKQWRKSRIAFPGGRLAQFPDEPVAATYAWTANDTVQIKVCAYQTPFIVTYQLKFGTNQVTLDAEANVSFGPRKQAAITGNRN